MLQYIASFIFVLALIGLTGWILKRVLKTGGIPAISLLKTKGSRIQILEVTMLDTHRRLVLIRRDNKEHLILTGGPNDLVLETDILSTQSQEETQTQNQTSISALSKIPGE